MNFVASSFHSPMSTIYRAPRMCLILVFFRNLISCFQLPSCISHSMNFCQCLLQYTFSILYCLIFYIRICSGVAVALSKICLDLEPSIVSPTWPLILGICGSYSLVLGKNSELLGSIDYVLFSILNCGRKNNNETKS
jgi:hypothetical protein